MKELLPDTVNAIIGVGGTLCGTILGWVLAKIDFGRVQVVLDDFKAYTTYIKNKEDDFSVLSGIELTFSVKIFNASSKNQVLRDFYVVCLDEANKQVYRDVPKDKETEARAGSYQNTKYIEVINIPSNSGLDIHAGCRVQLLDDFLKTKKLYLYYKTGAMKQRRKLIVRRDFSYIEKQREDTNNG